MSAQDWREARVVAVRDLTEDIRAIEIAPTGAFAPAASGAHLEIAVVIDGRPDTRAYSIFEAMPEGRYRIAVKRVAATRGGSSFMWRLAPGASLSVSGPKNNFSLTPGAPEYLLIAGGIGVTPIYAHAHALARVGAKFRMLYGARRRGDFALADSLEAMLGERLQMFSSEGGERIDLAAEFACLDPQGEAYVCGPIGMLEAARHAWRAAGRPAHLLRIETFAASGAWPNRAFRVKIPRLGKDILVPENRTILEAFEGAGVEMIFDCRKGECGLCALPILAIDGVVDHRDVFFSEEEKAGNAKLCTCVSRVHGGSITLDTADR